MIKSTWVAVMCGLLLLTGVLHAQTTPWRHEMKLVDYMGIYNFPEELLSFDFTCPAHTVQKEHLKLLRQGTTSPLEYQLSNVVESGGYLTRATVHFRSDLPRSSSRVFTLTQDPSYTASFVRAVRLMPGEEGSVILAGNLQQIRVPGEKTTSAASAGPLLGLSRDGGKTWVGGSSLLLPQGMSLSEVRGSVLEEGPLFLKYRLLYRCSGNRTWQVDLTIQHNEKHVLVDEILSGFSLEDAAYWKLSYQKGLEPDARLAMCNGGYFLVSHRGPMCGAYDSGLTPGGALPYQLGLYTPNSYGVSRSTVFWNEQGSNALIFALNRMRDWKTPARRVWSDKDAPENLYFYRKGGDSYARLALVGTERHWALSLAPRTEVVISELPATLPQTPGRGKAKPPRSYVVRKTLEGYAEDSLRQFGAGPEVRLWQKLTDFSLNKYKDIVFDFEEPLTPYDPRGKKYSFDDYMRDAGTLNGGLRALVQRFWDVSGNLTCSWGKDMPDYANSRAGWSEAQRRQVRSMLIFIANFAADDTGFPHTSMMAGHPNFVSLVKSTLPIAAAVFPKHPEAARWKAEFLSYWEEWLSLFTRRENPQLATRGGRWMENVACYWAASLHSANDAADAMQRLDGTQIYDRPLFRDVIRWTLDALSPSEEERRRLVPIGAHARGDVEGPRLRWAADLLSKSAPALASQLLWCLTDGHEGSKPALASRLYTDYGAVMWHDFGGPHEAFLTIQQLDGRGYRWTPESNGALYYATKGHRWSWNGSDQSGDRFNINLLPLFNLDGKSLGAHKVDGLLYDFGFAQYYKAAGSNLAYPWRGVMMLRDDYLAIYDHVADPRAQGKFQWCNYESYLAAEYFAKPDFTDLKATRRPQNHFTVEWDAKSAPLPSMKPGPCSVRWSGQYMPQATGELSMDVNLSPGDTVRIWLAGQLAYDSSTGKTLPLHVKEGEFVEMKVEYSHFQGDARLSIRCGTDKVIELNDTNTFNRLPMPQVYAIKVGAGDQMHIVAPGAHQVESKPYGAVVDGREYVFGASSEVTVAEGPASFSGLAGYARENEVALFEGTRIGFKGLTIERLSGDFGLSAGRQAEGSLAGGIVGRSGGSVRVTPPAGLDAAHCQVKINGAVVPHALEGSAIRFEVQIAQSEGVKSYTVSAVP